MVASFNVFSSHLNLIMGSLWHRKMQARVFIPFCCLTVSGGTKDLQDQLYINMRKENLKLKEEKNLNKAGIQCMELKKQLQLSYCQAITFHLLLKSEGHPVRDHPLLAPIVEIKNLLDKMKPVDENLVSFEVEDFVKKQATATMLNSHEEIAATDSISLINNPKSTVVVSSETQKELPHVGTEFVEMDSMMDRDNGGKRKRRQNEQLGLQSVEMLKVRAALEEKLKQKGVFNLKAPKTDGVKKNIRPLNGKLEAVDDFDDDTFDVEGNRNKSSNQANAGRLSQLVHQMKKPRVISGDDDLPKRDDIGERRRKHELRVLASAGIQSGDDDELVPEPGNLEGDGVNDTNETDSEPDLYKETKIKRDAKLVAKAHKYSRMSNLACRVWKC